MRPPVIATFLVRSAIAALLVIIALSGPAGFVFREESAEAAFLAEVKKLLASDGQAWDSFGLGVAVSGDTAFVGAPLADAEGVNSGAVYVFERDQGGQNSWGEVKKLTVADAPGGWDQLGRTVAVDGDTAVVGGRSAAYVFQRDEGGQDNWGEVKKLTSSSIGQLDERFGRTVAVGGDTVVVGAHGHDLGGAEFGFFGAAYVFARDQGGEDNWGEVKLLIASNAESTDFFGMGVAVSGDTVVVGAPEEDVGTKEAGGYVFQAGAAYVFQRDEGGQDNWGEVKKFNASDAGVFAHLGESVAVSGDTALVGARYWRGASESSGPGAAYIFQRNEGGTNNWGEVKLLTAADGAPHAQLGFGVALSGDTAVVGAPTDDEGGPEFSRFGAAYVFGRDQGGADNWGVVEKLRASDPDMEDWFGRRVAVNGDTVLIGARNEDASGESAGAAYVFKTGGPGDSDQDGCTDKAENGPNAYLGGQRDNRYFWDFFDVWTHPTGQPTAWERDTVVNVFDILAVALRFGAGPQLSKDDALAAALAAPEDETSYHAAYDRGPIIGANNWDRAPADGGINIVDDLLGVMQQFGHDCS